MVICLEAAGTAANPKPADGANDVPADSVLSWAPGSDAKTHDVYLGTALADVDAASRATPGSMLVSLGQDANTLRPAHCV